MAVTSIWPIKGRISKVINYARDPKKTTQEFFSDQISLHAIGGVVEYTADDMKTEKRSYVSCIRCTEENAAQQFMETKKLWQYIKGNQVLGGRVCFHGYQSFAAGEVSAETAHEIGKELVKRLWGDDFEAVIATHCNTGHYHNHIIINSVSWRDGHRFHNGPDDYQRMKDESDRLCIEYGLSVVETPAGKRKSYKEYSDEKNSLPTIRGSIRADIDRAISATLTEREFLEFLENMGYEIKRYTDLGKPLKYPALKPPGAKGFFRFHKLGEGYALEDISERILRNYRRKTPFPEDEMREFWSYRKNSSPKRKLKGLHALYVRYCFELHIIQKFPASVKRVPFTMREDLAQLNKLDAQLRFLAANGIETIADLNAFRSRSQGIITELSVRRNDLRNELKRATRTKDESSIAEIKSSISGITAEIGKIKKELGLCDGIEERSARMEAALNEMPRDREEPEKEVKDKNGHIFIGRGGRSCENSTRRR